MSGPFVAPAGSDVLRVVSIPLVSVTASGQLSNSGGWLLGWMITEDTGVAPATVRLLDGNGVNGGLIAKLPLLASAMSAIRPSTVGWPLSVGLWMQIDAGAVSGSVVIGHSQ